MKKINKKNTFEVQFVFLHGWTLLFLRCKVKWWYPDENQKDVVNRKNGQGPNHLKFFLLVFSKDEA